MLLNRFTQRLGALLLWTFLVPMGEAHGPPSTVNIESAWTQAALKNKPVLLLFTGSDWSPRSIALDTSVFDRGQFLEIAKKHFVVYHADYPQRTELSETLKRSHIRLLETWNVHSFPTLIAVTQDRQEIGRVIFQTQSGWVMENWLLSCLRHFEKTEADSPSPRKLP
jgi:thioredoxin-related protein